MSPRFLPVLLAGARLLTAQGTCGAISVSPSTDYSYAVASSDSGGSYQWTLDGKPLQSGVTTQTLLLHADGNLRTTSGAQPVQSSNVSFLPGRWGQAFAMEQGGTLTYSSQYLPLDEGTIEMWVAPRLSGNDPLYSKSDQSLFNYAPPSGTGVLRIGLASCCGSFYAGIDPGPKFQGVGAQGFGSWKAQEWHHIAFTYSASQKRMRFFLDGALTATNTGNFVAPGAGTATFSLGTPAYLLFDEFRISHEEKSLVEIRESALRLQPAANNEVWLQLSGVAAGSLQYQMTPTGTALACPVVIWAYTGVPLTGAAPPSNLLPAGTGSLAFSVRTSQAASCAYSIGKLLDYAQMTPFDSGQGDITHQTNIAPLDPSPAVVNHVYVRCDLAPGYVQEFLYRSVAAPVPRYPRIGSIWLSSSILGANFENSSKLQLYFGTTPTAQQLASVRAVNPNGLIFTTVSADETSDGQAQSYQIPDAYFLKDTKGKRIEGSWPLLYKLNLTKPEVADFLANLIYMLIVSGGLQFDGCFIDNFHTTISYMKTDAYGNDVHIDADGDGIEDDPARLDAAWGQGVMRMLATAQALLPNALFAGHIRSSDAANSPIQSLFNGQSDVFTAVNVREGLQSFPELWSRYTSWFSQGRQPVTTMIESSPPNQIAYGYGTWNAAQAIPASTLEFARTFYPNMRFGLAISLMGDGYFTHNFGDVNTVFNDLKTLWWYDEYGFDLGTPLGPPTWLGAPVTQQNLVRNPSFELPFTNDWKFSADRNQGAAATLERTTSTAQDGATAAHITVTAAARFNNVQFWDGGLPLEKGAGYTLSFWAKASSARGMQVNVLKDGGDFHGYGLSFTAPLGSDWQQYVLPFQATETAADGRVNFYFGEQTGDAWLDNVSLMRRPDDIYRRDFTGGVVLLNGTPNPVHFAFEPGFVRFTGQQAPRAQYLIDDTPDVFTSQGSWRSATIDSGWSGGSPKASGPFYHSWNRTCHVSDDGSGVAQWQLNIPEDGEYTVQTWWAAAPQIPVWTKRAVFEIVAGGNVVASATLDETTGGDQWHTIAKVQLSAADAPLVRVHSEGTGALIADALHVFSTARLNDGSPSNDVVLPPFDGLLLQRQQ